MKFTEEHAKQCEGEIYPSPCIPCRKKDAPAECESLVFSTRIHVSITFELSKFMLKFLLCFVVTSLDSKNGVKRKQQM